MIASVKRSSSGSSRRRSQVAPVSADIGFIVMLPHSLYQTSAWMRLLTVVSKPAAPRRSASALTRPDAPPDGSPMIRPRPKPCFTRPGSRTEQVACTTQPITCRAGMAVAIPPSGSTACTARAVVRPRRAHGRTTTGTPFIAVSTAVSGPSSGRDRRGEAGQSRPLHRDHDQILETERAGVLRHPHGRGEHRAVLLEPEPVGAQRGRGPASREGRHRGALPGQMNAEEGADRPRPHHADPRHSITLTKRRRSIVAVGARLIPSGARR